MSDEEHESSAAQSGPSTQFGSLVANVGGRIQEILETAERAAGEIQAEAEAAAAQYVQDRKREADRIVQERMAELDSITQLLAARAASVERETTAFVAEVEQVRWRMARLVGDEIAGAPRAPVEEPQHGAPPGPERTVASQAAALRATQMAVAGAERSEIERMLRDQFGIDDLSEVEGALRSDAN